MSELTKAIPFNDLEVLERVLDDIGGRIRKQNGRLVGLDMNRLKRIVEESRSYLFAANNYKEDIFADKLPKLY